ncbi:MAG TPA: cation-transporting P-type ATPase [Dissulfurispiraceae bacterium]|nr:cation-transporting P-type ATPase [Dissulfurispiraceae bacterium]
MIDPLHTAVPGRGRYRIHGLKRSVPFRRHLEYQLSHNEDILAYSVSDMTGNVLVSFNSGNTHADIASLLLKLASSYIPQPPQKPAVSDIETLGKKHTRKTAVPVASRGRLRRMVERADAQKEEIWHAMDVGEVLTRFRSSDSSGLSDDTAALHHRKYGPNLLPESVPRSGWSIFFDQFKSLPVALLGVAAGVSLVTGGIADAIVIGAVVCINGVIGYTTESQAEKTINSLKSLVRPSAVVLRNGRQMEVAAEQIVPGDILLLRPGSYVAADARLVAVQRLTVDESALTGESIPVQKIVKPLDSDDMPLGDRVNMVYMGTLVTGGQGVAVVIGTGKFTEIGKIQSLVGEATPPQTPMERQLDEMGTQLVVLSGAVCGLVFVIGLLRGYGFLQMLKSSISLAVAAVPEGLPTVATTTLALGIRRMKQRNVLIRHLEAVETLGSLQTICFDKTGTITMNRMTVVALHSGMRRLKASDGKFTSGNAPVNPYQCDELLRLLHIMALNSESTVEHATSESSSGSMVVVNGSPTENALVHIALSAGVDVVALREQYPMHRIEHRSENRNFIITLHGNGGGSKLLTVKGSPSEVLAMCDTITIGGETRHLNDDHRDEILRENEKMAGEALRVLGVACKYVLNGEADIDKTEGYSWLGLVGMIDPVRPGVRALVGEFHKAGIATVMITGDQSPTAYAIGKRLNLSQGDQLEILDSSNLNDLDAASLKALCDRVHVFARVSPANKLQIVQALQATGKVVAMTGDGINDGPALKAAAIGIAMGHTGTDVAREVADVVLEDDNLETMIVAIAQGRTIYNNIRKSVHFLLSTNLSEIMVMFTCIAAGLGHPLNAMQLLWVNLVSDIFPGIALALEPPEPDILARPPRDPHDPIIMRSDFKQIGIESAIISASTMGAYLYGLGRYGMGPRAGSLAFMTMSTAQLFHAFSCRSESHSLFSSERLQKNHLLNTAIGGSLALQVGTVLLPPLRNLLGLMPLSVADGLIVGGAALASYLSNETVKHAGIMPSPAVALVSSEELQTSEVPA